jgi:ATP-dependent helicase/nuclease subunit B
LLKIVSGRIASSKTQYIIDSIGERIKNRQKSILIVPDPVTYNFEQRLCSQLNIKGFIDVEVTSFNRLASSILDFFGKNKKTYLDDCTKAMGIRACLSAVKDSLTIFKSASTRKGFSALCLNMISIFENCGYTPEDLLSVTEKLPDGVLKMKLYDMALIYKEYNKLLTSGYTDNANMLKSAEELLPYYSALKDTVIYIDGFDVFTSRLLSFIGGLSTETDIFIAISSSDGKSDSSAYEIHDITLKKLIAEANKRDVKFETLYVSRVPEIKSPEIRFIEDNFYSSSPVIYNENINDISLCFYASREDEINYIAKKISERVKQGARYKSFAVLCNDMPTYTPIIRTIFSRYDIPVYTDKKHDITAHPVAVYLFSLLKCAYLGFTPENITDMALSSLTNLTRDEKDLFISFIKEMGIKGYELENGLYYDRGNKQKQADFDALRKQFVLPIKEFRKNIISAHNAKEMASCCYKFLEEQGIYERIQLLVDEYEAIEFFELSDITAQLWNKMQQLLENISDLLGNKSISVQEFTETLFEGFKSTPVSTIPSVIDCVTFGDLSAAKEQNVPYVFIIGANDGVIPKLYSDERLVSASESATLLEYGLELQHSVDTEDARIRFLVYSALCAPTKQLELSCPMFSSSGSPLRPSPIFKRFKMLFKNIIIVNPPAITPLSELEKPYTKEQAMLYMAMDRFASDEAQTLAEHLSDSEDRKFKALMLEKKQRETEIPSSIASELFLPNDFTSISKLEDFASCPFLHFIKHGLAPKAYKEYTTDAADVGTMIHSTLERFTKENAFNSLTRDECYQKASEIFDKVLPEIHFGAMLSTERQKAFNSILKNLTCESAWQIKEHIKGFSVIGEEIKFGTKKYPPIEIKTDYGTLYIKGTIDRADKLERDGRVYLRITDYKSGSKLFNEKNVKNGTDLQLMIYMNALLSYYKDSVPASAQYMLLSSDNTFSGPVIDEISDSKKATTEKEFRELLKASEETAKALTENIFKGDIHPVENKACEYCEYCGICGISANKTEKEDFVNA